VNTTTRKRQKRRDMTFGTGTYHDIDAVKKANADAGQHFFEPSTMRFFRSRISEGLEAGRYFVTSEQFDYDAPRLYSVREALSDGSIEDVSGFQAFETGAQAWAYVRRLRPLSITKEEASTLLAALEGDQQTSHLASRLRRIAWED
jgi:hypothetical protein